MALHERNSCWGAAGSAFASTARVATYSEGLEAASSLEGSRSPAWDLLLSCIAVYLATAVGRIHEVFPILQYVKPTLLAAVMAIALYLLQRSPQRRLSLVHSRTTACLIGLVLWGALSVPAALNQGLAFQSWTDFARTIVMCFVVAASVRRSSDVERLFLVYFGVTVAYTAVVLSRFQLGGGDTWRLGDLYTYDANDLATLIVTAMPLGLYFVIGQGRLLRRLLAVGGLIVLAVGLISSGSRGGFLAFLAVAAFVLVKMTTMPARSRIGGLVAILVVLLGTASNKYWTQMQTIAHYDQDYNVTSETGRVRIWKRGMGYMIDHPLLGVGMRNFPVAEGTISPQARRQERGVGVWWGAAHNTYVQVGAELGFPGLLLYLGVIGAAWLSLRRVSRRALRTHPDGGEVSRLAQSLMASLVGFAVGSFFLSLAYADMVYMLIALTVGLVKCARGDVTLGRPMGTRWRQRSSAISAGS
jgi:probable O-glycosylation ligase (exosortase A-associated)